VCTISCNVTEKMKTNLVNKGNNSTSHIGYKDIKYQQINAMQCALYILLANWTGIKCDIICYGILIGCLIERIAKITDKPSLTGMNNAFGAFNFKHWLSQIHATNKTS
jgi:hypothetical protein